MTSSTSNSKSRSRRRDIWIVVLGLVFLFVALETFTRLKFVTMSKDLARLNSYPMRATQLANEPGVRVALFGNSTTERGVDVPAFEKTLGRHIGGEAGTVHSSLFIANSSKINDWYYMINHNFWRRGKQPDLFILTYFDSQLSDGNSIEIGRLAQFFVTAADWPEVFRTDLTEPADRLEFMVSYFWATYAVRDRAKQRVLSLIVPRYEDHMQEVNRVIREDQEQKSKGEQQAHGQTRTHHALVRLLRAAQARGSRLCFVAFPTDASHRYDLDLEAERLIRSAGMEFIDLRRMPELTAEMYEDPVHLTPQGRKIYARRLSEVVAPLVRVSNFRNVAARAGNSPPSHSVKR